MRILSFDASTSTIGYAILDKNDDKIIVQECNHYKPIKKGNIFERLLAVEEFVADLIIKWYPDEVCMEEIAKFMPRMSSANTIIQLAVYNRVIGFTVFKSTNQPPHMFNVMAIRHGLKINKQFPKKEEMPELLENILNIKFPYVMKKTGKIAPETYDRADALAVAAYFLLKKSER